jgi:hypothetical protein
MPDSVPRSRTAFRLKRQNRPASARNTVRHHTGILSAINPESVSGMVRITHSTTEIAFPAQHDHLLLVRWHDDEIKAITKGRKLKQESIDRLIRLVQSNLMGQAPDEFGADVLLAGCPVPAGFRCDSIPLQILPPPDHAPHPPWISADHPFVLEFPLPRCELPELRFQRRSRRATEWARALNVFLPTRIQFQGPRIRQCWGMSMRDEGIIDKEYHCWHCRGDS